MTLPAPEAVPPIVLLVAPPVISTPGPEFGIAMVPAGSVPIMLPTTTLPSLVVPLIETPGQALAEIELPVPGAEPPMVLPDE